MRLKRDTDNNKYKWHTNRVLREREKHIKLFGSTYNFKVVRDITGESFMHKAKRLQGIVVDIERTGEKNVDDYGNVWEKCIFTVELVSFSKRSRKRALPTRLKGKKVKLIRWCCFDWHYKLGARKTLDADETEAVLKGEPTDTVFW